MWRVYLEDRDEQYFCASLRAAQNLVEAIMLDREWHSPYERKPWSWRYSDRLEAYGKETGVVFIEKVKVLTVEGVTALAASWL